MTEYFVGEQIIASTNIIDNSLRVFSFEYQEDCGNSEHEIIMMDRYNDDVDELRVKMFSAGYWWSIELPYEPLPEGGLIVRWRLVLDWEVTFEKPWDPRVSGYDFSPTAREEFHPAIPSDTPFYDYKKFIDDDGFCTDSFLMWHWDYDN